MSEERKVRDKENKRYVRKLFIIWSPVLALSLIIFIIWTLLDWVGIAILFLIAIVWQLWEWMVAGSLPFRKKVKRLFRRMTRKGESRLPRIGAAFSLIIIAIIATIGTLILAAIEVGRRAFNWIRSRRREQVTIVMAIFFTKAPPIISPEQTLYLFILIGTLCLLAAWFVSRKKLRELRELEIEAGEEEYEE